jgi:hypothetical protein
VPRREQFDEVLPYHSIHLATRLPIAQGVAYGPHLGLCVRIREHTLGGVLGVTTLAEDACSDGVRNGGVIFVERESNAARLVVIELGDVEAKIFNFIA